MQIGIAHVLVPLGAVLSLLPFVSPGVALAAGAAIGLTLGNPLAQATRKVSSRLLQLSVIGLGAGMDLRVVVRAGESGVFYTFASIAGCLALGWILARLFKVESNIGTLIAIGTAICGGSAIAAVAPVLRPKEHEVTVALATVFLLNGVALFLFPLIGHRVGLTQDQFGLWAALSIHDTSSVVGAGMAYGPRALEVATTVKLARALWIVPVTMGVGFLVSRRAKESAQQPKNESRDSNAARHANASAANASGAPDANAKEIAASKKSPKPWFIAGFLIAAALATFVSPLHAPGTFVGQMAKHVMSATLFLIGAGLTRGALRAVGVRALVFGVTLWVVVASLSLAALVTNLIGA